MNQNIKLILLQIPVTFIFFREDNEGIMLKHHHSDLCSYERAGKNPDLIMT